MLFVKKKYTLFEGPENRIKNTGFKTMANSIEFADNYSRWIVSKIRPYIKNSILEVGTGQGNYKVIYDQYADEYYYIDIDGE